jgi:hypothetical protein
MYVCIILLYLLACSIVRMYVFMYVCMYVCMYVYVCLYVYICVCVSTWFVQETVRTDSVHKCSIPSAWPHSKVSLHVVPYGKAALSRFRPSVRSPASCRGGTALVLDDLVDLLWKLQHSDRPFFPQSVGFSLSESFHKCSLLIHTSPTLPTFCNGQSH